MKITYILNLDLEHKAGLYHAIHNRMLENDTSDENIYINLITRDSFGMKILKKLTNKKIHNYNAGKVVEIDGIVYHNFYYRNSLISKIWDKTGLDIIKYSFLLFQLRSLIKNSQMIVTHYGYPHGRLAYFINRLFNTDYTVYFHGSDIHTFAAKNEFNKKLIFEVMETAKVNLFVSEALKQQVKQLGYSKENIYSTMNGINTNIFNLDQRLQKSDANLFTITFVGNLEYVKRAELIPQYFERIKRLPYQFKFNIIGDGTLKQQIEEQCQQKKIEVNYTGRVDTTTVASYLSQTDIMLLPSRREAWGCVVLEANACGAYVIGTKTGGLIQSVGDYGTLVENNDETIIESLAIAVQEVIEKGINSHILAERAKTYSWEEICKMEHQIIFNK